MLGVMQFIILNQKSHCLPWTFNRGHGYTSKWRSIYLRMLKFYKSTEKALAVDNFYHVLEAVQKNEKKRITIFKDYIEEYKKHFNGTRIISMIEFVNKKEGYNLANSILLDKDVKIILESLEWNKSYELWYAPTEEVPRKENATSVNLEAELEPIEGWEEVYKKMKTKTCVLCDMEFSYDENSPPLWTGILYDMCGECSAAHNLLN